MALCITAKQKQVLDYYRKFHAEYGVFPNTSDAAKTLNKTPQNITAMVGALFLKGAFTDGKPLTNNLGGGHKASRSVGLTLGKTKVAPKAQNIDAIVQQEIVKYFRNMAAGVAASLNE